ncbi:MAG: MATE family efflux transporter, partial [Alphaproteobacteria bacterium]|nr:MATE family efflux transporter [Alphaproteobacteria bacterium]
MAGGEHKSAARRARILDGPIGPTLARLAVPTVAGALIQITISVVEGAAIGRLGIDALAGSALVFPLYMLTAMLSAGAIGGAVSG